MGSQPVPGGRFAPLPRGKITKICGLADVYRRGTGRKIEVSVLPLAN
jgi:hypothetical protein